MKQDLENEIRPTIEYFVENTLGDMNPDNMCFVVSFGLNIYLNIKGIIKCKLTSEFAKVYEKNRECGHYVICIEEENEKVIVIDPTIQQFFNFNKKVFIGSLAEYEKLYVEPNQFKFQLHNKEIIDQMDEVLKYPLTYLNKELDEDQETYENRINRYYKTLSKTLNLINIETKIIDHSFLNRYQTYKKYISEVLRNTSALRGL